MVQRGKHHNITIRLDSLMLSIGSNKEDTVQLNALKMSKHTIQIFLDTYAARHPPQESYLGTFEDLLFNVLQVNCVLTTP